MPLVKSEAHALAEAVSAAVLMSDQQHIVMSPDSFVVDNGIYIIPKNNHKTALDLLELKLDNDILSLNQRIIVRLKKWFSDQINNLTETPHFYVYKNDVGRLQILPIKKVKEESLKIYRLLNDQSQYYIEVVEGRVKVLELVKA